MKELTKAEEQVMQVLWNLKKAFVKDVIKELPLNAEGKKPAYNTISTIIRILETKGFVGHTAYGKTYEYYPLVEKKHYQSFFLKNFLSNYFGGSFEKLVSFFAKDSNMDVHELEEMLHHVKDHLKEGESPQK
ncbi:BlaI/MecI/CopY family transcriptional regulator [Rapidithrix thailandica]|uniref:BlaI/MecI/CopY family transcriptional regulator n=1 Tax=Rapidithrix thailandica TaxID=413964 RepID=A0AAW9S359_9BACT